MLKVTVTNRVTRNTCTVRLNGFSELTPKAAVAARDHAQGSGPAEVSRGDVVYRVNGNTAKKHQYEQ
jgi:hypothetical protein